MHNIFRHMEKYPRGRRGSPAKGVVRENRSQGSNPCFSATWDSVEPPYKGSETESFFYAKSPNLGCFSFFSMNFCCLVQLKSHIPLDQTICYLYQKMCKNCTIFTMDLCKYVFCFRWADVSTVFTLCKPP